MRVAIIGGGVSGLSCARTLNSQAPTISYTLFDTGKRSVGGRCSSREVVIDGEKIIMDHAAQYIHLSSQSHQVFRDFVTTSVKNGALMEFDPQFIGQIDGNFQQETSQEMKCESQLSMNYVSPLGMGHFTRENLMEGLVSEDIKQDVWINKLVKKEGSTKWNVYGKGEFYGEYDKIIIAHNGKCADRLVSSVSGKVPAIHERLKVNFGPNIKNMRKMHLCSLFVLAFVVPVGSIPIGSRDYHSGQYAFNIKTTTSVGYNEHENSSKLTWICNTSKKINAANGKYESWTLISTKEYAAENKVPQEAIPQEDESRITHELISDFQKCMGLSSIMNDIKFSKLQLWGAAIPLNRLNCPFIYDGKEGIGVCGDWFDTQSEIGPSIETAFMSGHLLARHIISSGTTDAYIKDNQHCYEAIVGQNSLGDVDVDLDETYREIKQGPLLNPLEYAASVKANRLRMRPSLSYEDGNNSKEGKGDSSRGSRSRNRNRRGMDQGIARNKNKR